MTRVVDCFKAADFSDVVAWSSDDEVRIYREGCIICENGPVFRNAGGG